MSPQVLLEEKSMQRILQVTAATMCLVFAAQARAQIDCEAGGTGTGGLTNNITVTGGQINMAGATLFVDFFRQASSTNDWIDVDSDGFFGFRNPDPTFQFVDQLTAPYTPGGALNTYWAFNYRSVGSVRGFEEFIDYQLCDTVQTDRVPSEAGVFNRYTYASLGVITPGFSQFVNSTGTPLEQCDISGSFLDVPGLWAISYAGDEHWNRRPTDPGYGLNNKPTTSGFVPRLQLLTRDCTTNSLDFDQDGPNTLYNYIAAWVPVVPIANRGTGAQDVKFSELQYHFTTGRFPNGMNLIAVTRDVGSGTHNAWMNSIGVDPSHGRGDNVGNRVDADAPFSNPGASFQPTNTGGSGLVETTVRYARLALGYTGLAESSRAARDAFLGQYEVLNTCKDVDQFGGPLSDCTPATGAACEHPNNGYVRPSIATVLDNCDPACGYQIAGSGSFITRGHRDANRDPSDPQYNAGLPPVTQDATADYLNNIFDSIQAFSSNPNTGHCSESDVCTSRFCSNSPTTSCTADAQCPGGTCTVNFNCVVDADCTAIGGPGGTCTAPRPCTSNAQCPGGATDYCGQIVNSPAQGLAVSFFLPAAVDCVHEFDMPLVYNPQAVNATLQTYTRASNGLGWGGDTPAFGSVNTAGQTPTRTSLGSRYSDGQTQLYVYWNGSAYVTIAANANLSRRNRLAGDMNEDGVRDVADAGELVTAYYAPRAWQKSAAGIGSGTTSFDRGAQSLDDGIPEILADFDVDGHLSKEDLRYFMDGLATSNGLLDRRAGAIAIDNAIATAGQLYPWADAAAILTAPVAPTGSAPWATYPEPTFIAPAPIAAIFPARDPSAPLTYKAGDFRADVAGRTPAPGWKPSGWDGRINGLDIDYCRQFVGLNWADIDDAQTMDLSCDMDGDVDVDCNDIAEIVEVILETTIGDVDLNGIVDATDVAIISATIADVSTNGCNFNANCGWMNGDLDGDRDVDAVDLAAATGGTPCADADVNCDGSVNGGDILGIRAPGTWNTAGTPGFTRADVNDDGAVNGGDILSVRAPGTWNTSTGPCTCGGAATLCP
jgi:hypothetical protein